MLNAIKLCLLTQIEHQTFADYLSFIRLAVSGGITSVQLRNKHADALVLQEQALLLKAILDPFNIPLILNDHVDLAKDIDAAGIHLGQSDTHPDVARAKLGPNKIIGLSIETQAELELANKLSSINYVAASAVFPTQSKSDCKTIWGLEGLRKICQQSIHPVVAIGGIQLDNIAAVSEAGVAGVALIGALHQSTHPDITASKMIQILENCHV